MTIRDLGTGAPASPTEPSVCIVGGGMAGLVLGQRLARAGIRVLTLESGGLAFDAAVHRLNAIEDPIGRYTRAMTGRYRGLGGSSSHWGGRMLPISAHERGARDYLGLDGWLVSPEETDRYGPDIEKLFGIAAGPFGEDVLDTVDRSRAFPRDDPDFVCRWAKWPKFVQCNLGTVMRREIETSPNWEVWLNATVTGFSFDRERGLLSSVTANGPTGHAMTVTAPRFVIAAGTLETTRLLLWMRAEGDGHPFSETSALGHYFQEHVMARVASVTRNDVGLSNRLFSQHFVDGTRRSLHLELSPQAQREDLVPSAFAYVAMDYESSPMDTLKEVARGMQAGRPEWRKMARLAPQLGFLGQAAFSRYASKQLFMPRDVAFNLEVVCEQAPKRDNRIELSANRDRCGVPMLRLHWAPGEADERTFRSVIGRMDRYWRRGLLDARTPLAWTDACNDPRASITATALDYAHPAGTTRMGISAANSVVDADLACHEVPNVSVVSASVFPTSGSANPTFTIMQLAMRLADRLIAVRPAAPALQTLGESGRA